jgi:spore germination protein GerM
MVKFKYLILSLILGLVLAGCGQGTDDSSEEDANLGSDSQTEQQDTETEIEPAKEEQAEVEKEEVTEVELLETINLYFTDNNLMTMYRVEVEANYPKNEDGIKSALELWAAEPAREGLSKLVPEEVVTVQSVENVDGVAHVSFSNELLEANLGSSGEIFLIEQIVMVVEQFGYNEVLILIDGEEKDTLLGHIDLSEPFPAGSPEDYELYQ